jgi:hypothetical protein
MRLLSLFLLTSTFLFTRPASSATNEAQVYICVSNTAKVYHQDRDCRGLEACTHTIKKVSESTAINDYGRRACKVCY